ncbi:MAG: hypothetical protein V3W41_02780 [Planctomycetota bacterium]
MTFSDRRIIAFVEQNFIPVWETVSPVRVAVFKLGDGKEVKGTVGGEIALSFCRHDGLVYDILPALQSPAVTYRAIVEARGIYEKQARTLPGETSTKRMQARVIQYHLRALSNLKKTRGLVPKLAAQKVGDAHGKLISRLQMGSKADRDVTRQLLSKTMVVTPAETITVVEPGGLWLYKALIHDELRRGNLRTPAELKIKLFEEILDQPLKGGTEIYDIDDVMPLSLFSE